jgi:hypothetical protein
MPIQVVCPGCKTRFNVSEKFGGQKGPCPKCKAIIEIPKAAAPEVKIQTPEGEGPRDSRGKLVLKPIARRETRFSLVQIALIFATAVIVLGGTAAIRVGGFDTQLKFFLIAVGLAVLSPVLAAAGYSFLRDDELEPYSGRGLWLRSSILGVIYALSWLAFAYIPAGVLGDNTWAWLFLAVPFLAIGGLAAFLSLDLDFGSGVLLYSFYVLVTILLRALAGMGWIWEVARSTSV